MKQNLEREQAMTADIIDLAAQRRARASDGDAAMIAAQVTEACAWAIQMLQSGQYEYAAAQLERATREVLEAGVQAMKMPESATNIGRAVTDRELARRFIARAADYLREDDIESATTAVELATVTLRRVAASGLSVEEERLEAAKWRRRMKAVAKAAKTRRRKRERRDGPPAV